MALALGHFGLSYFRIPIDRALIAVPRYLWRKFCFREALALNKELSNINCQV